MGFLIGLGDGNIKTCAEFVDTDTGNTVEVYQFSGEDKFTVHTEGKTWTHNKMKVNSVLEIFKRSGLKMIGGWSRW